MPVRVLWQPCHVQSRKVAIMGCQTFFASAAVVPTRLADLCSGEPPPWSHSVRLAKCLANSVNSDLSRTYSYTLRSEEHTSELQSLMRISYAVFCLKKKTKTK